MIIPLCIGRGFRFPLPPMSGKGASSQECAAQLTRGKGRSVLSMSDTMSAVV